MTNRDITTEILHDVVAILQMSAIQENPRAMANLLLVAIGRVLPEVTDKELALKLVEISEDIIKISSGVNWDLYISYKMGNFSSLSDNDYIQFMQSYSKLLSYMLLITSIFSISTRELEETASKLSKEMAELFKTGAR